MDPDTAEETDSDSNSTSVGVTSSEWQFFWRLGRTAFAQTSLGFKLKTGLGLSNGIRH